MGCRCEQVSPHLSHTQIWAMFSFNCNTYRCPETKERLRSHLNFPLTPNLFNPPTPTTSFLLHNPSSLCQQELRHVLKDRNTNREYTSYPPTPPNLKLADTPINNSYQYPASFPPSHFLQKVSKWAL